ncbi:alpha/beta fold hydrolase [Corynebacterium breve]|uniref:Alpha/beta fold hydrolase n=1 Tax=Corynebacterium breve TaxID=3049799 RepID=A0ABY8VCI6_9CORY|nr:lipase family protein [Corynebacterium breve]WIM67351.1 alpha/beta fold hydrolase [Corynebacterium breve]
MFRHLSIAVTSLLTCVAATFVAAPAAAQPPSPTSSQWAEGVAWASSTPAGQPVAGEDPFYLPPADLGSPGDVLRTQPAPHLLNVLGPEFPGFAEKFLYTSTTVHGDLIGVSGVKIEPANPWQGAGPTPTVIFAPGTRGAGDACAPSKGPWLFGQVDPINESLSTNYELAMYSAASLRGMRVVITDYIGLGTPGAHTYVLHEEEAHAVLDAARATTSPGDPVAFFGYSQGGGAVAAAAEHLADYAPDINLKGTYSGAAPADLVNVMGGVDNSSIAAVLAFAYHGWGERYPEFKAPFDAVVNAQGRDFLDSNANACIPDGMLRWGLTDTSTLTTTGESLPQAAFNDPHVLGLLDAQRLGFRPTTGPILVATGGSDDLVPSPQTIQMASDYCAAGSNVLLVDEGIPELTPDLKLGINHAGGMLTQALPATNWLVDRFNDVPATSNCGGF